MKLVDAVLTFSGHNSQFHRIVRHITHLILCLLAVLIVSCSPPDRWEPAVWKLTEPSRIHMMHTGRDWITSGPEERLSLPSRGRDFHRLENGRHMVSGTVEIPSGVILHGIQVTIRSKLAQGIEFDTEIHLSTAAIHGEEVEGFPHRMAGSGKSRFNCRHRYDIDVLYWWAEISPVARPAENVSILVEVRAVYADRLNLSPGFQWLRASGETRASLLFTPGTDIILPLPEGAGWQLNAGVAQPVSGCAIDIVLEHDGGAKTLTTAEPRAWVWNELSIELPLLTQDHRLRIVCRGVDNETEGCLILGDPVLRNTSAGGTQRPNILIISLDTVRADALEPWGKESSSPRIARLAEESVVFTHAYAPAPVTDASHRSLFSGLDALRHTRLADSHGRLPDTAAPIAETVQYHDYRTGGFTDGGLVGAAYGFHRGFDRYWEYSGSPHDKLHLPRILELARRWIYQEDSTAPWLTFIHTYQAHTPYVLHEDLKTPPIHISVNAKMPQTVPLRFQATLGLHRQMFEYEVATVARRHYDSEVRYLDDHIGTFLDELQKRGILDRTLLVICSDHGEGFGEHGLLGHNNSVYEEQLRVPLMIRFPGRRHKGKVVATPVRLVDVVPTILDYLDIPFHGSMDGRTLLGAIEGQGGTAPPIIAKHLWNLSVTQWPHKLITGRREGHVRLYDLENDPHEKHNLIEARHAVLIDSLKSILINLLLETETGWALLIGRPESDSERLTIMWDHGQEFALLFRDQRDQFSYQEGLCSMRLAPSPIGDIMLLTPSIERLSLAVGDSAPIALEECLPRIGSYDLSLIPCTGDSATAVYEDTQLRTADHTERLRALGYME